MRWLVLVCALLFGAVTTAQAAHLHRPATEKHSVQLPAPGNQSADTEEHCPLCAAMHPALPSPLHVAEGPVLLMEPLPALARHEGVGSAWTFARFSRPPPPLG